MRPFLIRSSKSAPDSNKVDGVGDGREFDDAVTPHVASFGTIARAGKKILDIFPCKIKSPETTIRTKTKILANWQLCLPSPDFSGRKILYPSAWAAAAVADAAADTWGKPQMSADFEPLNHRHHRRSHHRARC